MNKKTNSKLQKILKVALPVFMYAVLVTGIVWGRYESTRKVEIIPNPIPSAAMIRTGNLISQTKADINVIPDKFNTGCHGDLTLVAPGDTVNGVVLRNSADTIVLEFAYKNTKLSGTVEFNNCDFSKYSFSMVNEAKVSRSIHVIFNNCKFGAVKNSAVAGSITYEFNNCTIKSFYGSSATFERCQFGHSYSDCMNVFQNVSVNYCYFCDLASEDENGAGKHSDGFQIYGYADSIVKNVSYHGCRFEIPAVQTGGNTASVNACMMLQLEFCSAEGISFSDCIINGGGYSIYARVKYPNKGYTMTDVSFDNIIVGDAHLYGTLYPDVSEGVRMNNVCDQNSLYVSSVWEDGTNIHIIVSNDTNVDRILKVRTGKGESCFTIPACLSGNELRYNNYGVSFEKFPFDIDITVPSSDYVVCYDSTEASVDKQIRMISFNGKPVYEEVPADIEKIISSTQNISSVNLLKAVQTESNQTANVGLDNKEEQSQGSKQESIVEGSCGKNASFFLDMSGTLHIEGNGIISNYNSSKNAPWYDYSSQIKNIIIGDGITQIGTQAFRKLSKVESVDLPKTLVNINANAFIGCTNLKYLSMYSGIEDIGKYAFSGAKLEKCVFYGTESEWNNVKVGTFNGKLLTCEKVFMSSIDETTVVLEGMCGKNAGYELLDDGTLHIFGNGAMNNYSSVKNAPWYDYAGLIMNVKIDDGITTIGAQSFRNARMLTSIELPESVTSIGANAFINCKKLQTVVLGSNILLVGKYAFAGTDLTATYYAGDASMWSHVAVGDYNSKLINSILFMN